MTLKVWTLGLAGAALLGLAACASSQKQEPVPTPTPEPVVEAAVVEAVPTEVPPLPTPEPTPVRKGYVVQKGDSLWEISGDPAVLGDNFRWPLLFKANRDQIIDPDLIEPAQDLTWKEAYTVEDVTDAVTKAKETPPFVPHSKPRKQLPLKY
jgi:nucleoid-associated protein YgaU